MGERNPNGRNSLNFFIRNCLNFDGCRNHVKKYLEYNNITDFEIKPYGKQGILALYIYKNENIYIIYMDTKFIELKLVCSKDDYKQMYIFPKEDCYARAIEKVAEDK